MDKVKVGFIGAGNFANTMHYPSLSEMKDVEIVSICDLDVEKLNSTADKYSVEGRYTDYKKMLDEVELDAVYVIMPPHHLFDLVIESLNRKLNVFIEKPPGVTKEQTRNMALLAEKNGCLTMVGFNRRFIPLMRKAKDIVEERGPIIQAISTFYKSSVGSLPYYNGAIDILTCDAVHAVDTLRWMAGGEVVSVASDIKSLYADYDNSFNALACFESGAVGVLLTNWVVGKRIHTFEMHSKGISAFVDPNESAVIYSDNKEEPQVLKVTDVGKSEEYRIFYGYYYEDRHFIDCLKEEEEPETSFSDALRTMELVETIYGSQI